MAIMKWAQERIDYCQRALDYHTKNLEDGLPESLIESWVRYRKGEQTPQQVHDWLRDHLLPDLVKHCRSEIERHKVLLADRSEMSINIG
jgi:macrodomain Ter protein organizer (MatP/YcbG family)